MKTQNVLNKQMTNVVGRSLFAKAGELGAPVGIMVMKVKDAFLFPLLNVFAVIIGLWDSDSKNNVAICSHRKAMNMTKGSHLDKYLHIIYCPLPF